MFCVKHFALYPDKKTCPYSVWMGPFFQLSEHDVDVDTG
jgi:hypothetical protein